ncbi:MAG: hypothetical protein ACYTHM_08845 [Planctomycetota bacterium]|jgi:hypothetical protein
MKTPFLILALLAGLIGCNSAHSQSEKEPVPPGSEKSRPKLFNERAVVSIETEKGERRVFWFQAEGDSLVERYMRGQIKPLDYRLTSMGEKVPEAPGLDLRTNLLPPPRRR